MLVEVVSVRPLSQYRLWIKFEDGVEGEIDLSEMIEFQGVFEWLKDPKNFEQVKVNKEMGVIYWPNGADLDSDVLYAKVTGKPCPQYNAIDEITTQ